MPGSKINEISEKFGRFFIKLVKISELCFCIISLQFLYPYTNDSITFLQKFGLFIKKSRLFSHTNLIIINPPSLSRHSFPSMHNFTANLIMYSIFSLKSKSKRINLIEYFLNIVYL